MDAYTSFAQVYDLFMDNVPYDEWCAYICETLKKHGIADGPVLDLGCGTGELTRRLAACGYDMTGVDVSVDMLQKAMEKQTDPVSGQRSKKKNCSRVLLRRTITGRLNKRFTGSICRYKTMSGIKKTNLTEKMNQGRLGMRHLRH